jgi:hypothetical protein
MARCAHLKPHLILVGTPISSTNKNLPPFSMVEKKLSFSKFECLKKKSQNDIVSLN